MQKKRRIDRGFGCIVEMKGDLWNIKLKGDEIEEISCTKSKREAIKEPREMGKIVGKCKLGFEIVVFI